MRKSDITYHSDGNRPGVPAVNVKVHTGPESVNLADLRGQLGADEGFTLAWIKEHVSDDTRDMWWNSALEDAWERLEEDVNEERVFGRSVKIYSQGRSGGWAVVDGITRDDVIVWDAIQLAQWAKFAKFARQTADDVPFQYLSLLYLNVYERWVDEQAHIRTFCEDM